jgi:hypothetical protein
VGSLRSCHVGERNGLQAGSARCSAKFRKPSRRSLADEASVVFRLAAIALLALLAGAAYGQSCAPRESLEKAVRNYGEKQIGYGVDRPSEVYVTIYAARSGAWTFLMTPKNEPSLLCIVGTGTQFQNNDGGITGVLNDGSIFNISYSASGDWVLMYMDSRVMRWQEISKGYGWEVVIDPGQSTGG